MSLWETHLFGDIRKGFKVFCLHGSVNLLPILIIINNVIVFYPGHGWSLCEVWRERRRWFGISGNKVYQLAERWEKDCLQIKPNVLSILIGVNDFWHMLNGRYNGTIKTYRDDYKTLLHRTKQNLPDVKLIIGEPFAVPGIKAVDEKWFPAFDEYRAAAREMANAFDAVFIPYQSVFDKAQKSAPGVYWTFDGVHASLAGAHLMAHAWLEAIKG